MWLQSTKKLNIILFDRKYLYYLKEENKFTALNNIDISTLFLREKVRSKIGILRKKSFSIIHSTRVEDILDLISFIFHPDCT